MPLEENGDRTLGNPGRDGFAEDALHFFGSGIGRDIKVIIFDPTSQKKVTDSSAYKPGLLAMLAKLSDEIQKWFRDEITG
jgi:hypothetical protein